MDTEQNQRQVSLCAHEPLEIAQADSHIPTATTKPTEMEIQKQDSYFPTDPRMSSETKERKPGGGSRRSAFRLISA